MSDIHGLPPGARSTSFPAASLRSETVSSTGSIKEFHKALEDFKRHYEHGDLQPILEAARHVQARLIPLLRDENSYSKNFKAWPLFSWGFLNTPLSLRWRNYLKPLHDFNEELTRLQQSAFSLQGYDLSNMNAPLEKAAQFTQREIDKQTGFLDKMIQSSVDNALGVVKEKYEDFTSGSRASEKVVHPPTSPLMKLLFKIGELKTSRAHIPDFIIEDQLNSSIEALRKSDPFFAGLERYILDNGTSASSLLVSLEGLVTNYIVETINGLSEDLRKKRLIYQAIHDFAPKNEALQEGEEQEEFGRNFLTNSLDDPDKKKIVWQAVAYALDLEKILTLGKSLDIEEGVTLSEVAEKIDRALSYLSVVQDVPQANQLLGLMTKQITDLSRATYCLVKDDLDLEQKEKVEKTLTASHQRLGVNDFEGALKKLSTLYTSGPVSDLAIRSYQGKAQSVVGKLALDFAKINKEKDESVADSEAKKLIEDKKSGLVESLTFFSAFQVIDQYCGYKGDDASEEAVQRRYEDLYKGLERIEDAGERKAHFLFLLNHQIEKKHGLGFFDKWIGRRLSSFTMSLVEYFSQRFTNTITEHFQTMLDDPINVPLISNHMGPIRAANKAMLMLLYAEEQVSSGNNEMLSAAEKHKKIFEMIENGDGIPTTKLVQNVVDKALKHLLAYHSYGDFFKQWKKSLTVYSHGGTNFVSRFLKAGVSLAGQGVLAVATLPFFLGHAMSVWAARTGASMLIHRLDLIHTTLNTVRDSIYENSRYIHVVDKILLDQLKAAELLLEQEGDGGSTQLLAGSKEKERVLELVSNLYRLADKQSELSTGLLGSLDTLTDSALKNIIRDAIISCYESIRTKQGTNALLSQILDQTAQSMKPYYLGYLWELYSEEEQTALGADQNNPDTVYLLMDDFAAKRGKNPEDIVKRDIDAALQELYATREQELQDVVSRLLNKVIDGVIEGQVNATLKTPQDMILQLTTFLENQFIPHVQLRQTTKKEKSYIEEMEDLVQGRDIEGLKKRHARLLNQLEAQLAEMKTYKGKDKHSDLQIQMLERMTVRLVDSHLRNLSNRISQENLTMIRVYLTELKQAMRREENTFFTIRRNIKAQEKSALDRPLRQGIETIAPLVRNYVKSRLEGRVHGWISLLKDSNLFTAVLREGIREHESYERKEPPNPLRKVFI